MELNPGSKEAIDQGCLCPIMDNRYGAGIYVKDSEPVFVMNENCPVHGSMGKEVTMCRGCGIEYKENSDGTDGIVYFFKVLNEYENVNKALKKYELSILELAQNTSNVKQAKTIKTFHRKVKRLHKEINISINKFFI